MLIADAKSVAGSRVAGRELAVRPTWDLLESPRRNAAALADRDGCPNACLTGTYPVGTVIDRHVQNLGPGGPATALARRGPRVPSASSART